MSDKNSNSYVSIGFPLFTLLVFFILLNINNADISVIDLTVSSILFALFWMFIITISVILVVVLIAIIIAILIS